MCIRDRWCWPQELGHPLALMVIWSRSFEGLNPFSMSLFKLSTNPREAVMPRLQVSEPGQQVISRISSVPALWRSIFFSSVNTLPKAFSLTQGIMRFWLTVATSLPPAKSSAIFAKDLAWRIEKSPRINLICTLWNPSCFWVSMFRLFQSWNSGSSSQSTGWYSDGRGSSSLSILIGV